MLELLAEIANLIRADLGFYWGHKCWEDIADDRRVTLLQGITGDGEACDSYRVVDSDDPWLIASAA